MNKRQKHFDKVERLKNRFKDLTTEQIKFRLSFRPTKEAAIAYREILEDRDIREKETLPTQSEE